MPPTKEGSRSIGRRGSIERQVAIVGTAAALFALVAASRFLWHDDPEPILLLQLFPIALVATQFGVRGGLVMGALTFLAWLVWATTSHAQDVDVVACLIRASAFVLPGALIGLLADQDARAMHELEESERDLRFIAEESTDMISTHDPAGTYTFVSGICRQLLGYEPEELIGAPAHHYIHPDDLEPLGLAHAATLGGGGIVTTTYRIRDRSGQYVWVQTKARARREPESEAVQEIRCATRDVSSEESTRELARRTRDAARARVAEVLGDDRLPILFQPIVDLETRKVVAVEALARFADDGERPPDVWFEGAWEAGLGLELELLAIREAVRAFDWLADDLQLAVNASPQTVRSERLLEVLGDFAPRIVVEVTEHAELGDSAEFAGAVRRLQAAGARLAVDDVGRGFSGLSRLLDLGADILKLDLSLTRRVDSDLRRGAMATSLAAFGDAAGIAVIAEGIESEAELHALRVRGIGYGQGFHLGQPERKPIELRRVPLPD